MEDQQKRHIKEVYTDSALKSLSSELGNDSVFNLSFKSAHAQNTQTERINAMITESVKAKKRNPQAEYYDLSGNEMEPPLDLDEDSSSGGQNDMRNHIHIEDYLNSIRGLKNEPMLKEMEAERRLQEIAGNNTMIFKEELYKIHGEHEMHNMQQQQVINDLLIQIQTLYSIFSDTKPKPLFPYSNPVLGQHLRAVEMSQQSGRQEPASSFSTNDQESSHEPKGPVGRPRNEHGVPTESRKDPFWWQSQPFEFIRTQLSNRGWRSPHFQHYTQKGTLAKRLTK